jgi:P27 family predicted phage terminase small subunit
MVARRNLPDADASVTWIVNDAKVGGLGLDFENIPPMLADAGLAEWSRLGVVFQDQPTRFREGDRAILIAYCATWGLYLDAVAELAGDGLTVEGRSAPDRGRQVKNPVLVSMTQLSGQLRFLARELGLTPDSRAKLGLKDSGEVSDVWNPFQG